LKILIIGFENLFMMGIILTENAMSFIKFEREKLVNLSYSLDKELIRSNRAGGYASSTIINCHTRKYHGLLVIPQPQLDNDLHVMLSSIDETIIYQNQDFNTGIHKYPNLYDPKGHKYIKDFTADPRPVWQYGVGDFHFSKEILLQEKENRVFIRYVIEKCESKAAFRFKPFLAFRNYHTLSKANVNANTKATEAKNGAAYCLYSGYDFLFIQFSKKPEYVHAPDWYYNLNYIKERDRGYDYQEDLLVPGYFEIMVKAGDEIIISVGTEEIAPRSIKSAFEKESANRVARSNFKNCLLNASRQFFATDKTGKTGIRAGLHWFGQWGRDTFIALPGLTLTQKDTDLFFKVIDDYLPDLKHGLFPNVGRNNRAAYNSVDASLWFIWCLQQHVVLFKDSKTVWTKYKDAIESILNHYKLGTLHNIAMHENGLIWQGENGLALTWMDAIVDGVPVTPRTGYCVEINALWYNAVCFYLDLAKQNKYKEDLSSWSEIAETCRYHFNQLFVNAHACLADYHDGDKANWSVRPNQLIVCAIEYDLIPEQKKYDVLQITLNKLLTPRGLRTLIPDDPNYRGLYEGNQAERDRRYHNGTVWPWLLQFYAIAYLKLHGTAGISHISEIYHGFEPVMQEHGVSTVSEVYDGDPPHTARGAISQAWSVAALLYLEHLITSRKSKKA